MVYKENDKSEFNANQFEAMIASNADGLGIMYVEGDRVKVLKSVGTDKAKRKLWESVKDFDNYAMHARLRTHGLVNEKNCHPYEILNMDKGDSTDLYVMHNGIIQVEKDIQKTMSDTWNFIEGVLKPIAKADINLLWNNENIQVMIQKAIGYSKLLFMRSDIEPVSYTHLTLPTILRV